MPREAKIFFMLMTACPANQPMIVVDTSALMAIVLNEAQAQPCIEALAEQTDVLISAGTLAEVLIVADRRNLAAEVDRMVNGLGFEIINVTAANARLVRDAYKRWGKGVHPAGLNFGDCFAYVAAKENNCPLLFVGNDFSQTDVKCVLS